MRSRAILRIRIAAMLIALRVSASSRASGIDWTAIKDGI